MKKVVINTKQLKHCLNESNNVNVGISTTANTIPGLMNAVSQSQGDIDSASKIGDPVLHISNPNSLNGSNDDALTQHVEVGKGDTVERAMQNQLNPAATGNGGDIEISGDGISEARYSKKSIEEARLRKMRNEGTVLSKRQLAEAFADNVTLYRVVEYDKDNNRIEHEPHEEQYDAKQEAKAIVAKNHDTCYIERKRAFGDGKWELGSIRYFWSFNRVLFYNHG